MTSRRRQGINDKKSRRYAAMTSSFGEFFESIVKSQFRSKDDMVADVAVCCRKGTFGCVARSQ
jgi:hypothetical protein